jgi:hypothetical protein
MNVATLTASTTPHVKAFASKDAKRMMRASVRDGRKATGGACAKHGMITRRSMSRDMSIMRTSMNTVMSHDMSIDMSIMRKSMNTVMCASARRTRDGRRRRRRRTMMIGTVMIGITDATWRNEEVL